MGRPRAKRLKQRLSEPKPNPQQQQFVDFVLAGMMPAEAAKKAGYASGDGPTYDANKAASVLMAKPWIAAAIAQGALNKAKEGGALSENWLKDKLLEGISKPMRSSQVQCLLAACRTIPGFFKDKEASDVTVNVAIVNDLAERIAEGRKRLDQSRRERGLAPIAAAGAEGDTALTREGGPPPHRAAVGRGTPTDALHGSHLVIRKADPDE